MNGILHFYRHIIDIDLGVEKFENRFSFLTNLLKIKIKWRLIQTTVNLVNL